MVDRDPPPEAAELTRDCQLSSVRWAGAGARDAASRDNSSWLPDAHRPDRVDRLIIHQWDAAKSTPGGIAACLRGLCRYAPATAVLAVVGVDSTGTDSRALGRWERHRFGENTVWFMPVCRLDPGDQSRRKPHSLHVLLGVLRYVRRLPRSGLIQTHRADLGLFALLLGRRLSYFVHTQDRGLSSDNSDSLWRRAKNLHAQLERFVIKRADSVVVFNDAYAPIVRNWNPRTLAASTWFDPALVTQAHQRDPHTIVWVGRLEEPKAPLLALSAFAELVRMQPHEPWQLVVVGSGRLASALVAARGELAPSVASRVQIVGRLSPSEVATVMRSGGVHLMTSHAGYEGYPRVLIEAMANGLVPVVTEGADTAGLVTTGLGAICSRDSKDVARTIVRVALSCDRALIVDRVSALRADVVVGRILDHGGGTRYR